MKNEKAVKKEIDKIIKLHDGYICNPVTGGYGSSGHPDKIVCVYGKFYGIEVKFGNNKPTALQRKKLKEIGAAGGVGLWVNDKNYQVLDEIFTFFSSRPGRPIFLSGEALKLVQGRE